MMITQNKGFSSAAADIALACRAEANEAEHLYDTPRIYSIFEDQDEEAFERSRPRLQVVHLNPKKAPNAENNLELSKAAVGQIVRSVLEQLIAMGVSIPQLPSSVQDPSEQKKPGVKPADLGLTARETDVLRILAEGKSNKEICRALNIALGTVKIHTRSICGKLNVSRRTEAIAAVSRMGLVL